MILSFLLFFQPYLGASKAFALSTEEERILGQKFLIQIQQMLDLLDDDYAQQYLNDLGQYLTRPPGRLKLGISLSVSIWSKIMI
jgi:predicted Zn-dependent protease